MTTLSQLQIYCCNCEENQSAFDKVNGNGKVAHLVPKSTFLLGEEAEASPSIANVLWRV